jgi:hypothetical protein
MDRVEKANLDKTVLRISQGLGIFTNPARSSKPCGSHAAPEVLLSRPAQSFSAASKVVP